MSVLYRQQVIAESGLSIKELSNLLTLSEKEFTDKIKEKNSFTISETERLMQLINIKNPIEFFLT